MRVARSVAMGLTLVFVLAVGVNAEEKKEGKEVTLKGKVTCAKCDLKKADECTTVLVVKKGKKQTIYYFDTDAHKKYHAGICKKGKAGTVKGTVTKDDDRMVITVSEVKYQDDE